MVTNEAYLKELRALIREMETVLVAYSGGADSTFLAKVAHDELGSQNVLMVTAESEIYSRRETSKAKEIADKLGFPHEIIRTNEIKRKQFADNGVLRCYHCKQELFEQLFIVASKHNLSHVIDGQNVDDAKDFRPGAKAARELGIRSPLQEVGLTKENIRSLSKKLDLPTWNKPAEPCLSTRIPYGTTITSQRLDRIENAEDFLRNMGLERLRLRTHDEIARIEIPPEDFSRFLEPEINKIAIGHLKSLGYKYITLDLEGYRMGAMNEVLSKKTVSHG